MNLFLKMGLVNCLHCGSFGIGDSLLCCHCETKLFEVSFHRHFFSAEVRRVTCMALFHWQRDRNRILNRLSLALKGGRQAEAWNYYAEKYVSEWTGREVLKSPAVLGPCPSRDGKEDHASLFAGALSRQTGIPILPLLKRTTVKEQKHLGRDERYRCIENRFELVARKDEKFSQVYFVDDIVTSGATVAAAYYHLKNIGHVKGISLIIRE